MRVELRSGQKVVRGCRQRVLVDSGVKVLAQQLFWCAVSHRAYRHVGRGETADFVNVAGNPEVSQKDSLLAVIFTMSQHYIGGFDVSMQKTLFVGVVEGTSDRRDDAGDFLHRHPGRVPIAQKASSIEPVDKVHRDP
ncbi:hypothetical protein AO501_04240 [Mycobacterium gordonae]|uniref:Uncharacterized protein n=1 Tax=Mycobacterium gordonae TaxID=1778 RepID=A0A0Q2UG62_MYCGO|nr:hypothetical protein AO501_04240 [Mycobacterium gordonae]